jgi:methylmalonyl-CoA/ethylmalonyl-CoA epimerase
MRPVTLDHIAIATSRIADAMPALVGALGGRPAFGAVTPDYRFGQWQYEGGGRLEVLEPVPPDGFLARFLARGGPGIHHVTFKVPSLAEACRRAEARGYAIVGYSDLKDDWKEAFLHPKQALGIVVQLAESKPDASGGPPHAWQPPATVPDPPPAVTMIGLRMRARQHERARELWEHVALGAPTEDGAGALVFHWPASPLRIAVELDAVAPEGPVAIEYASPRPVVLDPESAAAVGARFVWIPPRVGAPGRDGEALATGRRKRAVPR